MSAGLIALGHEDINAKINGATRLLGRSDSVNDQCTRSFSARHVGSNVTPMKEMIRARPKARLPSARADPIQDKIGEEGTVVGEPPHGADQGLDTLWMSQLKPSPPSPPALVTAAASSGGAARPIGADTIGWPMPSSCVNEVAIGSLDS